MRWPGPLRKIPRPRLVITLAALFTVYFVLGHVVAARYIQRFIPEYAAEQLKRKASVREVNVNPLLFSVELNDFLLAEADGTPIVGFRRLLVDFELSSVLRWAWTFSTIALDGLDLRADIAPDGRFNLAELADSLPKGETAPDAKPARLVLQHLALSDGAITFSDRTGARPAIASLRPLAIELRDLSTLPDRSGPYSVTARLPGGGTLAWNGEVSLQPILSRGEISMRGAKLAPVWRFFEDELNLAEPTGEADLDFRYRAGYAKGAPELAVENLRLTLSGIALAEQGAKEPLINLDTVALEGGSFDLRSQDVSARRAAVKGGAVRVAREEDGSMRLLKLLKEREGGERPAEVKEAKQNAGAAKPWRFTLDLFEIEGLKIALADRSFARPVAYDVELALALKDLRSYGKTPVKVEAALRIAQGGSLRLSGEASPAGDRALARARLERLNLKPLQPMVASRTALALESGSVSATLQAQYRALRDRAELRAGGTASVDDLLLNEAGERFLEWKSVAASRIAFSLAPKRLAIGQIDVIGLGAKVLVNKDRSVNLVRAFTPGAGTGIPVAAKPPPPPLPRTTEDGEPPFPVSVERVRVENSAVDFSDLSLVLPFAAKIQELQGSVSGLSTERASRAVAKLEGRVDEFGLARVDGSLATFEPKSFLDLRVAFRNVEMSPLSAYSATFAGRRIASGRLSLDLQYKIDKGALAGDNKVELDKFTLGERVDAPGALSLPLDLAVALLTDADGKIAVAVPVQGDVDDPQFSYGHLIWQAIATVITNIATAPFRALFGGGGENVENIAFDAGRAALLPPEREKLKRVADALGKRPQLKLVVQGHYGDADRAALRQRDVASAISARLDRAPAGEEPEPVNPRDAKTQRAMEALFVERASEQALAAFVAEVEKARGKPVQRVGPLAAFAGRASADGAFYDALLNRLNETAPLPGDALGKLAAARALAVSEHLEKALSVPPARVERKAPAAGDGERVKLALDVAGQGPSP
jgi:uncharacterized protein DUF748